MCSPSGHPRCRWVCFFMGTDLDKFCIAPLAHQWILFSEWVPSEWESKQLKKNNPQVIHTTPVHKLTSYEAKSCVFVRNKSTIKTFLASNCPLISIILLSPVKKLSRLNQERNMHRSSTVYKWKQSKTVLNNFVGGFWCERMTVDGVFHWRKRYNRLWTGKYQHFGQKWRLSKLKCFNNGFVSYRHMFLLHKTLIDGLELCGLLVDYCDVFISCFDLFWRHPFTAEDPLLSKWCNATFL